MTKARKGLSRNGVFALSAIAVALFSAQSVYSQDSNELEEVLVTGSLIKGTATDAETNVSVYDRSTMDMQNSPSLVEFTKNLSFSSGVDGDSNQFESNATEGLANVNLRGLGPARTLVLINGQRQAAVPVRLAAGRFVDINSIPGAAIERIEILKEGAAATYGSDAVGGVVNFITRSDFEGFELQGNYASIADSDGDYSLGAIFGTQIGDFNWVASAGYRERSQLKQRDRDFGTQLDGRYLPFDGFSTIGNPGTLYPFLDTNPNGQGIGIDTIIGGGPDPGCTDVGGVVAGGACTFQYTQFDNFVENEKHYEIFSEINGTLANGSTLHLEAMYADTDVPNWATSPSYPPQRIIDPVQTVFPDSPGWQSLEATFPEYFDSLPAYPDYIIVRGRVNGVGASGPRTATREYQTYRFAGSLSGAVNDEVDYTVNMAYSRSKGGYGSRDASIEKTKLAYLGYGGEGCGATLNPDETVSANGAVAGQGNCQYYNPFSTAIESGYFGQFVNPNYDASVANSQALQDWIDDEWDVRGKNELFTADVVFQQSFDGADIAYGVQYRRNDVSQGVDDIANINVNPCRVTGYMDCENRTGLHSFLAAGSPYSLDQTVYAAFAEASLSVGENLDANIGVRYENYGSGSDTVDPKVSLQYRFSDAFSLRASAQTTFRAPDPNQLDPSASTALQYVAQTIAFKAIDTTGNPDLDPESVFTYNIGLVLSTDNFNATVDYWYFDFDNPIITEAYTQLAAAYAAVDADDTAANRALREAVQDQITCQGGAAAGSCAASGIERINPYIVNGPRLQTDGIDFFVGYEFDAGMPVSIGVEGSYTLSNKVGDYAKGDVVIAASEETAGYYNFNNTARPIPKLRARAFATMGVTSDMSVSAFLNHSGSVDDRRGNLPEGVNSVDAFTTVDLHVNYDVNENLAVTVSAINAGDEEPPIAYGDLMYDAYNHNPLGRIIKAGFKYNF
jgi:iron complex outermembrane receptor protein